LAEQIMEAQANLAPTQEMEVVNEETNAEDEPANNDEEIADETGNNIKYSKHTHIL
jgi:hypothetical protein